MKKLLFIDHECHRKTRSAEFFLEIVSRAFDVREHYYSRHYRTGSESYIADNDIIVVWEFPISRRKFFFSGRKNIFVPMYDNEWGSFWQWKRIAWSGMGVISFCDKVSAHARKCGVKNILDVRYFPDPKGFPHEVGNLKRVFLWERGAVSKSIAERLFPPSDGYVFDVKGADEFLSRDGYIKKIAKCGIVIAPRCKEGIGMAFLEAMAMGKCVVACNDATMNEYIKDGTNGVLFNPRAPAPIYEAVVRDVLGNVEQSAADLHAGWLTDVDKINAFISSQKPCKPSFLNWIKITLSYPLFLLEGAVHVLTERLTKIFCGRIAGILS